MAIRMKSGFFPFLTKRPLASRTKLDPSTRRGKIIPEVIGFFANKIVGKKVDYMVVKSCFLKNVSKKMVI